MDNKLKKLIEYGFALLISVSLTIPLAIKIGHVLSIRPELIAYLLVFIFQIPVFIALHYYILKRCNTTFQAEIDPFRNYGAMVIAIIFTLAGIANYVDLKKIANFFGPGIYVLLYAATATIILVIFSRHFFAKPIKETWKAILLAGLIAGAVGCTASYLLWKGAEPYLRSHAIEKQVES